MNTSIIIKISDVLKNPVVKNIVSAAAVAFIGFILLNITFLFYFLYQSLLRLIVEPLVQVGDPRMNYQWIPPVMHASFAVVIGLISWPIYRSKLRVLFKAIYMTVPLTVLYATTGMFLYRWPIIVLTIGSLITAGILFFLYQNKKHWLYWYTVILVASVLAVFTLMGGEI